jgi:hypothetical protein
VPPDTVPCRSGGVPVHWLIEGWDQGSWIAAIIGAITGVTLVALDASGLAEFAALLVGVGTRWSMWQVPKSGRSRAAGTPPGALTHLLRIAIALLLVVLLAEVVIAPLR